MTKRFEGKKVFITGAASGIGKAAALAFAKEGASLALSDVQEAAGEEVCRAAQDLGAKAFFRKVDVSKREEVFNWTQEGIETLGGLDIALNNAGIEGGNFRSHEYPLEMFQRVMDINVNGVWYCMQAQLPHMLEKRQGTIINLASVAGLGGFALHAPYSASKHAVIGLTRSAAVEYGSKGIRINAVCPSFIETPMVMDNVAKNPEALAQLVRINPMKRLGKAEEISSVILFLASDEASYINGHAMAVDGGLTIT